MFFQKRIFSIKLIETLKKILIIKVEGGNYQVFKFMGLIRSQF